MSNKLNVLLIGSGGREHALARKFSQSPRLETLYIAPGNAGTAQCGRNVQLDVSNHQSVIKFCQSHQIGFVMVGPEIPLVEGLADSLDEANIAVLGPSKLAAQLEGSKGFTKDLCAEFNIPTAAYQRFNNAPKAKAYVREQGAPIVIKADGLAAGKGVVVAFDESEALNAIDDCFEGAFGNAGVEVVVEEFLEGEEASLFALCDGQTAQLLGTAQDHKRVGDGDIGPNTGGMGAYSPAKVMSQALIDQVMSDIIVPTLAGMHHRGMPFIGVLFAGLMLTKKGPQLIEYNVRFGDPETQVILPRLKSDLLSLLYSASRGQLSDIEPIWDERTALTVVMAANGYPQSYQKGSEIKQIAEAEAEGALVFHAGTKSEGDKVLANGGRVLNVTAFGDNVKAAQENAYKGVAKIDWAEGFYRKDIGWRAVERGE